MNNLPAIHTVETGMHDMASSAKSQTSTAEVSSTVRKGHVFKLRFLFQVKTVLSDIFQNISQHDFNARPADGGLTTPNNAGSPQNLGPWLRLTGEVSQT